MLRLLLAVSLCGALAGPGAAQERASADTADVYATEHTYWLSWPRLLWTALVYPLGQFTIYAEREQLPARVHDLFTNEAGTFGLFPQVQLGGETGSGGALRTYHRDFFGSQFEAFYILAPSNRHQARFFYLDPHVRGSRLYWRVEGEFLKTDAVEATINAAVRADPDRVLGVETLSARAALGWRPNASALELYQENAYAELRLGLGRVRLDEEKGPVGPLAFAGHTRQAGRLLGLGVSIPYYSVGGRIAYDDRDYQSPQPEISHPLNYEFPGRVLVRDGDLYHNYRNLTYPERGGLWELQADLVAGEQDLRFVHVKAEVQRFHTLFWKERVLALRARLEKVHEVGDGLVPHALLPTLGGTGLLRGYRRGFFRGEGTLLLSAEYRWPVWDTWHAFLFWDEGEVFDRYQDLGLEDLHTSWGGGIVLRTQTAFLLGFHLAHSAAEEVLTGFSLVQEF